MKASDKNRQNLSSSEAKLPNAKYKQKKWKVDMSALEDYIQYMSGDDES